MARKGKQPKKRLWWVVSILAIVLAGILAWYFLGLEHDRKDTDISVIPEKIPPEKKLPPPAPPRPETIVTGAPVVSQEIIPPKPEARRTTAKESKKMCVISSPICPRKTISGMFRRGSILLSIS
jgi:hypothetical protein